MVREKISELPRYREHITENGEALAVDENGEIDYSKRITNVLTREQVQGYQGKMQKAYSPSFNSFGMDQKSNINNSFFIFMIYQPMKLFLIEYPNLTKGDYARLVYLSTYLQRNGTKLKVSGKTYAKRSDIKKLLDIPDRTARAFLNRVEKSGVLYVDETGYINISGKIFKNGKIGGATSKRNFARYFIKNTRQLYKQFKKGKAIDKLGVLYSLVPYLDLKFNVLCKNANNNVSDISEVEPLTMSELAEILGYSDSFALRRSLKSLKVDIDGIIYFAVAFHEIGDVDNSLITVSPFFIYRDMPGDWMTKETHLIFYHDIIRQLKVKEEFQNVEQQTIINELEQLLLTNNELIDI